MTFSWLEAFVLRLFGIKCCEVHFERRKKPKKGTKNQRNKEGKEEKKTQTKKQTSKKLIVVKKLNRANKECFLSILDGARMALQSQLYSRLFVRKGLLICDWSSLRVSLFRGDAGMDIFYLSSTNFVLGIFNRGTWKGRQIFYK